MEKEKKNDMQVESNPRSDSRVSLTCHRLGRGRVTRGSTMCLASHGC